MIGFGLGLFKSYNLSKGYSEGCSKSEKPQSITPTKIDFRVLFTMGMIIYFVVRIYRSF